ncbi:ABC transporter permease [Amnibacterium setariae]|uniref:ABC transporter permease n=1 Tax=Amnibacterium setariae TaxID=2306585 RepID=A0A3A1U089_9MICO|nr:ABC transporter permease [Amnibacterium setariae]RIX27866.1 ABC transporter permease [Amnibacterium setariae]
MNLRTTVALALSRLVAARTRSLLTMLGVIIGVASLLALTSIASGATSGITGSLNALGATTVTVTGSGPTALTEADAAALRGTPDVTRVATTVSGRGDVVHDGETEQLSLVGVDAEYEAVQKPALSVGRFLPGFPGGAEASTVVLSTAAANALHVTAEDVGQPLTVEGRVFTLVGVLDDATGFTTSGTAYVPIAAARDLFAQTPYVTSVLLAATSTDAVDGVQADADAILRARYGLGPDDSASFAITNPASVISTIGTVQSLLSLLLGGIASISVLVGGIGIMNIMLVSVRERTREIGVRRAIGARRGQILTQFLVEAVVLSVAGGLIGIVVGIALSAVVAAIGGWALTISPVTVLLAVLFSVLVGVVFGVVPARTASRLQVVDALRFE